MIKAFITSINSACKPFQAVLCLCLYIMVDLRINETRQTGAGSENETTVLPFGRRCFYLRRCYDGDYSVRLETTPPVLD